MRRAFALLVGLAMVAGSAAAASERSYVDIPHEDEAVLHYVEPHEILGSANERSVVTQLSRIAQAACGIRPASKGDSDVHETLRASVMPDFALHVINIEYAAVEGSGIGTLRSTKLEIGIPYSVERTDDQVDVHLQFPSQGALDTDAMLLFGAVKLPPQARLNQDYEHIVAALRQATLRFGARLQGEVEAKYRPEAVFANFQRSWRAADRPAAQRTSLSQTFAFDRNGQDQPILITVFPYHDGSMVHFEAVARLELLPDGNVMGRYGTDALAELVAGIAND